jgi:protein-arginine kinase activator protein McsA
MRIIIVIMDEDKSIPEDMKENISTHLVCRSCGMKFDNLGDMQKHITVEHHQKGDSVG